MWVRLCARAFVLCVRHQALGERVAELGAVNLLGGDTEVNGVAYSNNGTSEVVMRHQFKAWKAYIRPAVQPAVSVA
jgi:hypothetical protein